MSQEYSDVLTLTVRNADRTKVLVGVRRPETNPTHPNVISTPTQRMFFSSIDTIIAGCGEAVETNVDLNFPERIDKVLVYPGSFSIDRREFEGYDNFNMKFKPLPHEETLFCVVEGLLAGKVGQAGPLSMNEISYIATPKVLMRGSALYDRKRLGSLSDRYGEPQDENINSENIQMLNVEVVLSRSDTIPVETASYSPLVWVTEDQFREMNEQRHTFGLPDELNSGQYCAHGLCLLSSYVALDN